MHALLALALVHAVALEAAPAGAGGAAPVGFRRVLTVEERAWYGRTLLALADASGQRCEVPGLDDATARPEALVPATAELLPQGAFPRMRLELRCQGERVTMVPHAAAVPTLPSAAEPVQQGRSGFLLRVFQRGLLVVSAGATEAPATGDLAPIRSVVIAWDRPWAAEALGLAREARWDQIAYAMRARLGRAPRGPASCAPAADPPVEREATAVDRAEVLVAALRHHTGRVPEGQLVDADAASHPIGERESPAVVRPPCLSPATLEAYAAVTATRSPMPEEVAAEGFRLRPRTALLELYRATGRRFEAAVPETDGYVSFSRVAFDAATMQALVTVDWIRGETGSGATYVLERREGDWAVLYVGYEWPAATRP